MHREERSETEDEENNFAEVSVEELVQEALPLQIKKASGDADRICNLLRRVTKLIECVDDYRGEFANPDVSQAVSEHVFDLIPDKLPVTILVPACRSLTTIFEGNDGPRHTDLTWAEAAVNAIERCIKLGDECATTAFEALRLILGAGKPYRNWIEETRPVLMSASMDAAKRKPESTSENKHSRAALKALAARLQDDLDETQICSIFLTFAEFVRECKWSDTPSKANCQLLADIYWGLSNGIATGPTEGVRRLLVTTEAMILVERGIEFASGSRKPDRVRHEMAAFISTLACPPSTQANDVRKLQSDICTRLQAMGAVTLLAKCLATEGEDDDGWVEHYIRGLLALFTWVEASKQGIMETEIAAFPNAISELQNFCAQFQPNNINSCGRRAGPAALLLARHLPKHSTNAVQVVLTALDTLRTVRAVEDWML